METGPKVLLCIALLCAMTGIILSSKPILNKKPKVPLATEQLKLEAGIFNMCMSNSKDKDVPTLLACHSIAKEIVER